MRIYTRFGDHGETSLYGGDVVPKDHPRIEAYGAVDELNAQIGAARALITASGATPDLLPVLEQVQQELFVLGGDLATPEGARYEPPRIREAHIEALERLIDAFDGKLPRLRHFVLPGGSAAAAALHVCRTVCRRAERAAVRAAATEAVSSEVRIYLNRLSDLLFVLARAANVEAGVGEILWIPEAP